MTIFKTFEEARNYLKNNPVGKSLIRLDDGSGFEVKSKNGKPTEPPQSLVDNDNEVLSVEDLKELIDVKQFATENINKPRKISKPLFTSTSSTSANKTKEVKDGWFERKYRQVVKDFKGADRRRKIDLKRAINRPDSKTKEREATQPQHKADHKRYIRSCRKCGAEIPKRVIEEFQYREDCDSCRQKYLSKFGTSLPVNNAYKPSKKSVRRVDSNPGSRLCGDCDSPIPQARIDNIPDAIRCATCQSKFEAANPDSVARKVEEKFGTREDSKKMYGRQGAINKSNKY